MPILVQFAQKAVIPFGQKILLVQKSLSDPYQPGRWELPGGRMEEGETPDQALEREVEQEVGLTVHAGRLMALWSWTLGKGLDAPTIVAVARLCEPYGNLEPRGAELADDHIARWSWVDVNQVLDLNLIDSDRGPIQAVVLDLMRKGGR